MAKGKSGTPSSNSKPNRVHIVIEQLGLSPMPHQGHHRQLNLTRGWGCFTALLAPKQEAQGEAGSEVSTQNPGSFILLEVWGGFEIEERITVHVYGMCVG